MQSLSYWKQFESTGKVEDYLYYSGMTPEEHPKGNAKGSPTLEFTDGKGAVFRECISERSVEQTGHGIVGSESL